MRQVTTIAKRISEGLSMRGIKQADLVAATGIGKSSISTYLSGEYEPKQKNIYKIAQALDVNEAWLMGYDVSPERQSFSSNSKDPMPQVNNLLPLPKVSRTVPILGEIACGQPILAEENYSEVVPVPDYVHADFALRCRGDSMVGARILDGDIVYIRQQPDVEDGEIAAVLIGDEATLKRVYKIPGRLQLRPENPCYSVMEYADSELDQVRILGRAVYFVSGVR